MLATPLQLFSASAGSGKTYTLTLEYIKLALSEVDNNGYFRRILAVTFTIKAAEEMRTRIVKALAGLSAYPDYLNISEKDKKESLLLLNRIHDDFKKDGLDLSLLDIASRAKNTIQQILQDYGLFSVMTIDAFVQRLSSSFVDELHLPSQFEVILDLDSLMNDLMDQLLDKVNQSGDPQLTELVLSFARQEVIDGRNWNRIRQSLMDFLKIAFKEDYFQIKSEMDRFSMSDFIQIELLLLDKMNAVEGQLMQNAQAFVSLVDYKQIPDSEFANGGNGTISVFRKLTNGGGIEYNKFVNLRKAVEQNKWYAAKTSPSNKGEIDYISEYLSEFAGEFLQIYDETISRYLLYKLISKDLKKMALISSINEELQVYQLEQSRISITEFARRINEIISKDPVPFIYEKLGDRYFHILIDEFQDTSVLQWKNFMPLLENTVSYGKVNLLVGDAKQSIYKFRGGEVSLIASLVAKDASLLGSKMNPSELDYVRFDYLSQQISLNQLESNYRSAPEIVNFNNDLFSWIAQHVPYQELSALLEPVYGQHLKQIPKVSSQDISGQVDLLVFEMPLDDEAHENVELTWMFHQVVHLINYNLSLGFRYEDMAILTRKNKEANFLALQLKEADFPIISADSLLVYYSYPVTFILALLKLKEDPKKNLLVFEAAYSLANTQGKSLSEEAADFLEMENSSSYNAQEFLNKYMLEYYQLEISSVWQEDNLYDFVFQVIGLFDLFNQSEGSDYIFKFLDIIQDFTLKDTPSISAFLSYFESNKHSFTIASPENVNAITITSIHKSKGLEYPVVILPFASWSFQANDQSRIWYDLKEEKDSLELAENQLLPYFYSRVNAKDLDYFPSLATQKQQEMHAVFLDSLNMLYVATTRAKQHLHILLATPNAEVSGRTRSSFQKSIGQILLDFVGNNLDEAHAYPPYLWHEFVSNSQYYLWNKSPEFIQVKRKNLDNDHVNLLIQGETFAKPALRVKSSKSDVYTLAKEKRERGDLIHKQLEKLNSYLDVDASNILPEIIDLLQVETVRDFFVPGELFMSEQEILMSNGQILRPDRVIKKNNALVVVDYKTSHKKEEHISQVKNYCEVFKSMGFTEVSGALIYTETKEVVYV
ncbi:UvrD-helicase domain-containing protein [Aquirufa rosea]|uniref:DNA 3'-5' helicase n=1 Tax=Aquirufa rosea TaxID=2509241 RepID=A0A4Q1C1Y2_9BACT|nr:UvrD-helicase domain-containing protein [Aquirufa rosea]RXK52196.1 Dna2/Cas4 domain-containing protein [Aquirufa rosea]